MISWSSEDQADAVAEYLLHLEDEDRVAREAREEAENKRKVAEEQRHQDWLATQPLGTIANPGKTPTRGSAAIETPQVDLDAPGDFAFPELDLE